MSCILAGQLFTRMHVCPGTCVLNLQENHTAGTVRKELLVSNRMSRPWYLLAAGLHALNQAVSCCVTASEKEAGGT